MRNKMAKSIQKCQWCNVAFKISIQEYMYHITACKKAYLKRNDGVIHYN